MCLYTLLLCFLCWNFVVVASVPSATQCIPENATLPRANCHARRQYQDPLRGQTGRAIHHNEVGIPDPHDNGILIVQSDREKSRENNRVGTPAGEMDLMMLMSIAS